MDEIKCKAKLKLEDFQAVKKLYEDKTIGWKEKVLIIFLLLLMLSLLLFSFYRCYNIWTIRESFFDFLTLFVKDVWCVVPISTLVLYCGVYLYAITKKKSPETVITEVDYILTPSSFNSLSNNCSIQVPWSDFNNCIENDELLIYVQENKIIQILPKRILNQEQLSQVKEWSQNPQKNVTPDIKLEKPYVDEEIKCSGTLTYQEYLKLNYSYNKIPGILLKCLFFPSLSLLAMWLFNYFYPDLVLAFNNNHPVDPNIDFNNLSFVLRMNLMVIILNSGYYFINLWVKKTFEKEIHRYQFNYTFTSEYFSATKDSIDIFWEWNKFNKHKISKYFIFLHTQSGEKIVCPTRLLNKDQINKIKVWLKQVNS